MPGIYIHIPFCRQKCHYCDFHFAVSMKNKNELINALVNEMDFRKTEIVTPLETIYFGGGTPSVLTENDLNKIFNSIYKNFQIIDYPEITLEANPDDLNLSYLQMLKNVGINRLSIGIQSFHDDELQLMNRSHNAIQALNAVKNAQSIGFENITIDLIYGMPDSKIEKWKQNIDVFFELNIPHLSAYALTVEHKTALEHMINLKKINPVNEQCAYEQFYYLRDRMMEKGFEHYEISNFSKPNFYSKHNTSYWQNEPYLGIGPSAHSYDEHTRSWNISNNSKYIKSLKNKVLPIQNESLTLTDKYNEFIMTRLRTQWGIDLNDVLNYFGEKYYQYLSNKVESLFEKKQLEQIGKETFRIGAEYLFLSDGIIADLFYQ